VAVVYPILLFNILLSQVVVVVQATWVVVAVQVDIEIALLAKLQVVVAVQNLH
jgi:hypothetical protein